MEEWRRARLRWTEKRCRLTLENKAGTVHLSLISPSAPTRHLLSSLLLLHPRPLQCYLSSLSPPTLSLTLRYSLFLHDAIYHFSPPSARHRAALSLIFRHFFPLFLDEDDDEMASTMAGREDVNAFYAALQRHSSATLQPSLFSISHLQHPALVPVLRPYQLRAVNWMIGRENEPEEGFNPEMFCDLFTRISPFEGAPFYYYTGCFFRQPPRVPVILPGGILADEMGLGKTVEVIALMLNNPLDKTEKKKNECRESVEGRSLDIVATVLSEIVSQVVAATDGREALMPSPQKRKDRFVRFEVENDSKRQRITKERLTKEVQCIHCDGWSYRDPAGWNLFQGDDSLFACPACVVKLPPVEGKATLIICPSTICHQWFEELKRHVGGDRTLKIDMYRGVGREGFKHPMYLAQCDVVLVSYETLRSEINFVDINNRSMKLRNPKRYHFAPTPLTAVAWWRICLDEAQMVESTVSKAAEMCMQLYAVNRWCITGTPIHKSIAELRGLMTFLGVEPYYISAWWHRLMWRQYLHGEWTPILEVMSRLLWRSSKADVQDQLEIPNQSERTTWLQFSPIEEQFYRQTADHCSVEAAKAIAYHEDVSMKLCDLSRQAVDELMRPLLSLRRCTVHPAIRRNGRFAVTGMKRNITQADLLDEMTKSTKRDCEESHRRIILAMNGLAGVHWLRDDIAATADHYRQALRSIRDHAAADKFRTDPLQHIHALHNLIVLINNFGNRVPPTCSDDGLPELLANSKVAYLAEQCALYNAARQKRQLVAEKRMEKEERFDIRDGWVAEAVQQAVSNGVEVELVTAVRQSIFDKQGHLPNVHMAFRHGRGLMLAIDMRWTELKEGRQTFVDAINAIEAVDLQTDAALQNIVFCHLRPVGGTARALRNCILCTTEQLISDYEALLYCFMDSQGVATKRMMAVGGEEIGLFGAGQRGTYADSTLEVALKAVLQFVRNRQTRFNRQLTEAGGSHLALIDAYKAEFTALKAVWVTASEYLAKMDEVSMAVERLRFRTEDEEAVAVVLKTNELPINVLTPDMLLRQEREFVATLADGRRSLDRHLGKLNYLDNLRQMNINPETGNVEECPICTVALGHHWAVLLCGHYFCTNCITIVSNHFGGVRVRCPVCRQFTDRKNVTYVQTKRSSTDDGYDDQEVVLGSFSTKIEAVVRRLLAIKRREPAAKALVFSSWQDVLDILSQALVENNIVHRCLRSSANRQQDLADFRLHAGITALLLPVTSGANGLNLVEASHVLFVEPLLNTAVEKQAIGRVHRIGQHRHTVVHSFLVRGSIEERLATAVGGTGRRESGGDSDQWTIAHLRELVAAAAPH